MEEQKGGKKAPQSGEGFADSSLIFARLAEGESDASVCGESEARAGEASAGVEVELLLLRLCRAARVGVSLGVICSSVT